MSEDKRIKERVKKLCDVLEIDHIGLISDGVKRLMDKFNKINDKIDKSEWKTKNPRPFEYDPINNIVDIFVRQDPRCPFPFHEEDWWHQGFYLSNFLIYLNIFFKRYNLDYKVVAIL